MTISEDKWFEVWYLQGVDIAPSCIYIVIPSLNNPQHTLVLDPCDGYKIIYEGKDYEETFYWLREDDFSLVDGRVFPDDGWASPGAPEQGT